MTQTLESTTFAAAHTMTSTFRGMTLAAVVGCGAIGGVFFAFSAFVMAGLNRLPSARGIAAMQSINITAVRPGLMIGLFGTAALCVVLGIYAGLHWGDRRSAFLLAGSLLYLGCAVVVTAAANVPLNDSLANLDPNSSGAASQWAHYVSSWTAWNHVRMVGSLAAAASFVLALTAGE